MSILQQVIQQYGNSETPEGLTDKTDKRVKTPEALTDKTDKRASVGSVSEWLEHFEKHPDDITQEEMPVALEMIAITRMRLRGEVPDDYTATTTCRKCGPVPIFEGVTDDVLGCPWCFNRLEGLPMPGGDV